MANNRNQAEIGGMQFDVWQMSDFINFHIISFIF